MYNSWWKKRLNLEETKSFTICWIYWCASSCYDVISVKPYTNSLSVPPSRQRVYTALEWRQRPTYSHSWYTEWGSPAGLAVYSIHSLAPSLFTSTESFISCSVHIAQRGQAKLVTHSLYCLWLHKVHLCYINKAVTRCNICDILVILLLPWLRK